MFLGRDIDMVIYITPEKQGRCPACGTENVTMHDNGMCWECTKAMAGSLQEEAGEIVFIKDTTIFTDQ